MDAIKKLRKKAMFLNCLDIIYCDAHDVLMYNSEGVVDLAIIEAENLYPDNKRSRRRKATVRHDRKVAEINLSICDLTDPRPRRKMSRLDYDNANRKRCRELCRESTKNDRTDRTENIPDYIKLRNNFNKEVAAYLNINN